MQVQQTPRNTAIAFLTLMSTNPIQEMKDVCRKNNSGKACGIHQHLEDAPTEFCTLTLCLISVPTGMLILRCMRRAPQHTIWVVILEQGKLFPLFTIHMNGE